MHRLPKNHRCSWPGLELQGAGAGAEQSVQRGTSCAAGPRHEPK